MKYGEIVNGYLELNRKIKDIEGALNKKTVNCLTWLDDARKDSRHSTQLLVQEYERLTKDLKALLDTEVSGPATGDAMYNTIKRCPNGDTPIIKICSSYINALGATQRSITIDGDQFKELYDSMHDVDIITIHPTASPISKVDILTSRDLTGGGVR